MNTNTNFFTPYLNVDLMLTQFSFVFAHFMNLHWFQKLQSKANTAANSVPVEFVSSFSKLEIYKRFFLLIIMKSKDDFSPI